MPIYEYICEDCQTHFEKIVLNKTQEIACPKCAGKRNAIQLSVFSAANGSSNGASAKSSSGFSGGGGGSCCGDGNGGLPHLFRRQAQRFHACRGRRAAHQRGSQLGRKTKKAPRPPLRKLLVHHGKR